MTSRVVSQLTLLIALVAGIWIRIQTTDRLPSGYFFDTDSFRVYRQADIISKTGSLPMRDMQRWLPIGRDLTTSLNLTSYALAYSHRLLRIVFPSLRLYKVVVYYPVVVYVLAAAVAFLIARLVFGLWPATVAAVYLMAFPAGVFRSVAGYPDRDTLCLLFSASSILFYLKANAASRELARVLWTALSAVFVYLLGMTWEGAGIFVAILVGAETARFLTTKYRVSDFIRFSLWYALFAIPLSISSAAYRTDANLSSPFAVVTLGTPSFVVLVMTSRWCMYRVDAARRLPRRLHALPVNAAAFVAALTIAAGVFIFGAVLNQDMRDLLGLIGDNLSSTLGSSNLMKSVAELQDYTFRSWLERFGLMYALAVVGVIAAFRSMNRDGDQRFAYWELAFVSLALIVFYNNALNIPTFRRASSILYPLSSVSFVLASFAALIQFARVGRGIDLSILTIAIWYFVTMALTRGSVRYEFFFQVPVVQFASFAAREIGRGVGARWRFVRFKAAPALISVALVSATLFAPHVGFIPASFHATRTMRPLFSSSAWRQAFAWMRLNLPAESRIAADWSLGSQIQTLTGHATLIDEDHYLPYWVYLHSRHVFCAQSDAEALAFLKSRGATHILMSTENIRAAGTISRTGSTSRNSRAFEVIPLRQIVTPRFLRLAPLNKAFAGALTIEETTYPQSSWEFEAIDIVVDRDAISNAMVRLTTGSETRAFSPRRIRFEGRMYDTAMDEDVAFPGVFVVDKIEGGYRAFYVSDVGVNSLLVRLFLLNEQGDSFRTVYPSEPNDASPIKMWEIVYPEGLKNDPVYLATDFPDRETKRLWMEGR